HSSANGRVPVEPSRLDPSPLDRAFSDVPLIAWRPAAVMFIEGGIYGPQNGCHQWSRSGPDPSNSSIAHTKDTVAVRHLLGVRNTGWPIRRPGRWDPAN